ncbi:MAG: hypothetical protein K2G05_01565, partial [Duncaniella sp.]|nr:hypothetical protein [Duncaniella sp.]
MRISLTLVCALSVATAMPAMSETIDRQALVKRNNPHVQSVDTMASLTVGNGEFAFTADVTGLQTFPEVYRLGVPLGTQSQWGWHSFSNPEQYRFDETLVEYDFGHGHKELYTTQIKTPDRAKKACDWYRVNPHRLHLGIIGFDGINQSDLSDIDQTLDLWTGSISSDYKVKGTPVSVKTSCHPDRDMVSAEISTRARIPVTLRFPYPTGGHADDACDWTRDSLHVTELVSSTPNSALLSHTLDSTTYYINVSWKGNVTPERKGRNEWVLRPQDDNWSFTAEYSANRIAPADLTASQASDEAARYWDHCWRSGGVVDFS